MSVVHAETSIAVSVIAGSSPSAPWGRRRRSKFSKLSAWQVNSGGHGEAMSECTHILNTYLASEIRTQVVISNRHRVRFV